MTFIAVKILFVVFPDCLCSIFFSLRENWNDFSGAEVEDMLRLMPQKRWSEVTANPPLTGEFATEVLDASGMQLLNVPKRCWSDKVLKVLEIAGILPGRQSFWTGMSTNWLMRRLAK